MGADALYGIAGHHLGYGVGHVGYAAHHVAPVHHAVHAVPVHHGYGISNVANTVGIHGVAPAAIPAVHGAYAGAGRYGLGHRVYSLVMDMVILDTLLLAMVMGIVLV